MRSAAGTNGRGARIALGAVILVAGLGLFVVGTLLRSKHRSSGIGPPLLGGPQLASAGSRFAGYQDQVVVTSISASWAVPAVAANSRVGIASTWIGAQGPGDPSTTPFIQIGVEENMVPDNDGVPRPMYEAFFSDTVRHFRPDSLFQVAPGDQLAASMRLSGHRWHLSITDVTTGEQQSMVTSQEATGLFLLAEWTQEDVTNATTNRAEPYPDVANPRITDLKVNGVPPPAGQLQSTWMSLPGGYLGPTAARGNAFSIVPVRLSRAGVAYLHIVDPLDAAGNRFDGQAAQWRQNTPLDTIRRQTNGLVSALTTADAQLRRTTWPASVAALMGRVETADQAQITALSAAAKQSGTAVQNAIQRTDPPSEQAEFTQIRRGLGIQESR